MTAERSTWSIDLAGALARLVVPRSGRAYEHRTPLANLERIAHAIDEAPRGRSCEEVAALEDIPLTQVAVAFGFLKERGCVIVEGRRTYAASGSVHLDALIEYHALNSAQGG